ncbi:MAG: hypothetical protein Ta2A_14660 [Treponemataceae bacterium]|nr:MAG: hypothetical protein Ta2A_14660 [Treponemataceae bacterium]
MSDTATVPRLTAYFNRLSDERKSEILGMAEAFAFTQRSADSDSWNIMKGILRENAGRELAGNDTQEAQ